MNGRAGVQDNGKVQSNRLSWGRWLSWVADSQALGIAALFISQGDKICAGVAGESRGREET